MKPKMQTESEWRAWLHRQAQRFNCCHDEADDLVQETLLAFWQRFGYLPWEQRWLEDSEYQRACGWCCQRLSIHRDCRPVGCLSGHSAGLLGTNQGVRARIFRSGWQQKGVGCR
jgi:hypothetical protein